MKKLILITVFFTIILTGCNNQNLHNSDVVKSLNPEEVELYKIISTITNNNGQTRYIGQGINITGFQSFTDEKLKIGDIVEANKTSQTENKVTSQEKELTLTVTDIQEGENITYIAELINGKQFTFTEDKTADTLQKGDIITAYFQYDNELITVFKE